MVDTAAHDAALQRLTGLKALCAGTCAELDSQIAAVPEDARRAASVARTVSANDDPVAAALDGGRLVPTEHLRAVVDAAKAVAGGQDAAEAAGADPEHVALLERAAAAHAGHAEALAAAFADYAAASAALASGVPPSNEPVGVVGPAGGQ